MLKIALMQIQRDLLSLDLISSAAGRLTVACQAQATPKTHA
jgi:hypothetical protein